MLGDPTLPARLRAPVIQRFALFFIALAIASLTGASAHDHGVAGIEIAQPWAPATAGQDVQVVYLTIRNRATMPDRLMRALSPVAAKVELHGVADAGGEPKPISELAIGAGQVLVLSGTGPHLALLGLKRQLLEHQTFKLALEFDVAGRIVVDVVVGSAAASDPHQH
jgi:periplasmic copper chaperone A